MSWHVWCLLVGAAGLTLAVRCAAPEGEVISLPAPRLTGEMSLEEAIARRRSVRRFLDRPLSIEQLSQLAWSVQGITDKERGFRSAPSAGALYPLEVYFVTAEATYHHLPARHAFEVHLRGDRRGALAQAALGQPYVRTAAVDVVVTAVYRRTAAKYGRRAERYVHIEVGHAAQNLLLQATALGLAHVPVGAFHDEEVGRVLELPADHAPLYILCVGYPSPAATRPF